MVANHLPLRLVEETEESYEFEWDDEALIGHVQARPTLFQLRRELEAWSFDAFSGHACI